MQSTVFRRKFRGASPYKGDLEDMGKVSAFLKRKNVLFSAKRYGIDAMGAMAQGLFATAEECSDYAASAANCAYELTFLLAGIVCFIYVVLIRKQKLIARQEAPKYAGAAFETAGQFAYIFALSDTAHVAISAPIISAYCVASVVWSRIFLKEKLSLKHYLMIALVVAGIVILGVYDG